MISEHSSAIVQEVRQGTSPSGAPVQLLIFANKLTLAVSTHALAIYRNPENFGDPLGNGLIRSIDFPDNVELHINDGKLVASIQSGCVNLMDDKILLILPNEVRLYSDRESALHNREALVQLSLTD